MIGDVGWGGAEKLGRVGMKLNIDDIPVLAEHLSEDWHILAVSFWRDFHPGRNLHTTREILIGIINGLASEKLVDVERLIDKETTAAEIKRIQAWAAKRAGRSGNDLKLDAIKRALENNGDFFDVRGQIGALVEAKDQRVAPHILEFLDRDDLDQYSRESLFGCIYALNPKAALPYARKLHGNGAVQERLVAALVELKVGDASRAVELLDAVLQDADYSNVSFGEITDVIELLIGTGRDDARQLVVKQFSDDRLAGYAASELPSLVGFVVKAGESDGLKLYRRLLENHSNSLRGRGYGTQVRFVFADSFLDKWQGYAPKDPILSKMRETTQSEPDARVEALKKWLDKTIREFKEEEEQSSD